MDEVARRREARRQRILQNSQNRLNRITGVKESSDCNLSKVHHQSAEEPPHTNGTAIFTHEPLISQEKIPTVPPKTQRTLRRQTVIVGLAIFIQIQQIILEYVLKFDLSRTHLDKMFLPLFLYEIIGLTLSQELPKHPLENIITIFLTGKRDFALTKYLFLILFLLQDVMIYFFFYTCCEFLKTCIRNIM